MKKTLITITLGLVLGILGVKYYLPYLDKDECRALVKQYQESEYKENWYATVKQAEICRKYNIVLRSEAIPRF